MTYRDFLRLSGGPRSLARAAAMPGLSDIDFDPPRSDIALRDLDVP